MKHIITFIAVLASIHVSSASSVQDAEDKKNLQIAEETLKKLGIDKNKIKLEDGMSLQQSCFSGILDEKGNAHLTFSMKVIEPIKANGLTVDSPASISVCAGKIVWINIPNLEKVYSINGYSCVNDIHFSKKGNLCKCVLAKNTKINGFNVAKGNRLYLSKGKPSVAFIEYLADDSQKDIREGVYAISKGKLIKKDDDNPRCNYEE